MNQETAKAIADFFLQTLENEHAITKKVLAALPESELAWRPHAKALPAGELAWHIVGSELFLLRAILAGQFQPPEERKAPASNAETLQLYESQFPPLLAQLKALPAEHWTTKVPFFGVMNEPAFVYLQTVQAHSVHHRGQMATYLRAMGEKVPAIYGGSADEPFRAPQAEKA